MKKILILMTLSIFIITSACSSTQKVPKILNNVGTSQSIKSKVAITKVKANIAPSSKTAVSSKRVFTISQLKKYNGQKGNPAYVAVDGIVYDVTHANGWSNGKHFSGVTAGKDQSKAILNSPHGKSVLKTVPIVGKLKK